MRHFVIGDVHNDSVKLKNLLSKLMLKSSDKVYFLGDLFDRCDNHADPLGVYKAVKELGEQANIVMGNHDLWLLAHIKAYLSTNSSLKGYPYNTFDIIRATLTREELFKLSEFVNLFIHRVSDPDPYNVAVPCDSNNWIDVCCTC